MPRPQPERIRQNSTASSSSVGPPEPNAQAPPAGPVRWSRLDGEERDTVGVTAGPGRGELLDDEALENSTVVANCAMNRERQLAGVNSYARELGFDPLREVIARIGGSGRAQGGTAAWLDLCCGSGRALVQAACQVLRAGLAGQVALTGVDLVDAFDAVPGPAAGLELVCAPAGAWEPARSYDLITCVHGLHYIGDKLALLARAASWLTPAGRLVADLDLAAVRSAGRPPPGGCGPGCGRPGSPAVPAVTRSPASERAASACRTPTSVRTTEPGPATPGSRPSPPITRHLLLHRKPLTPARRGRPPKSHAARN